jgi:LuxR family maltose regulon positive regulatory protein
MVRAQRRLKRDSSDDRAPISGLGDPALAQNAPRAGTVPPGERVPLVFSKLRAPIVGETVVARQRLIARLRAGRDRKLTLVCAPAGYGKTTLLAQWAAADRGGTRFVWLFVDEADSDPIRLWTHLIHGLHRSRPQVGSESLGAMSAGPRTLTTLVIPLLLQELETVAPTVLVVEDWHRINNRLCDETLSLFIERAPPALQVVVSCRSEPALPVARLRAHGELAEVREAQLRLSRAEAAALFHAADIALSPDDLGRLWRRTEGWVTALRLVSLLLTGLEDRPAFVAEFFAESRHVLDYLAHDVLDALPDDMREFLIRSSVLDYLSGPLCDAVLELTQSTAMLARIERANLFIVSLNGRGNTFRYHHIFATMLRRELDRSDPNLAAGLHHRASRWFEEHGEIEAAIDHAIAARSVPRSSDLVAAHARSFWSIGRVTTVSRWLDALSWPEAVADPQLALIRAAVSAQTGQPAEDVEYWLETASRDSTARPLTIGVASMESGVSLLRAIYLTRGVQVAATEAQRAVELELAGSSWRRQALLGLGQALYLLGNPDQARDPLDQARHLTGIRENAAAAANVLAYLALIAVEAGDLTAAERLARDSLSLLDGQHLAGTHIATNSHLALGRTLTAGTDLRTGIAYLQQATELSAPAAPGYWHSHALLRLADAQHRTGDIEGAKAALESARLELDALPDTGMLGTLFNDIEQALLTRPRREGFRGERLSQSELRVLRLLAAGRSVNEVARELYLSPHTVKAHRRTIYRKLGTASRTEAVAQAERQGLLPQPDSERSTQNAPIGRAVAGSYKRPRSNTTTGSG